MRAQRSVITLLCAATLGYSQVPFRRDEVPNYRPSYFPHVLEGSVRGDVQVNKGTCRGFAGIHSSWVISKRLEAVFQQMSSATMHTSVEEVTRTRRFTGSKLLADRIVSFSGTPGRTIHRELPGGGSESKFEDLEEYTTVTLYERPLRVGPLPKAWPEEAVNKNPGPKGFPGFPVSTINGAPDAWSELGGAGGMSYRFEWYVKEDAKNLVPRLSGDLAKTGKWIIGKELIPGGEVRHRPKDYRSNFAYIDISFGRALMADIPATGWTVVTITWSDPSSRVGGQQET